LKAVSNNEYRFNWHRPLHKLRIGKAQIDAAFAAARPVETVVPYGWVISFHCDAAGRRSGCLSSSHRVKAMSVSIKQASIELSGGIALRGAEPWHRAAHRAKH
jgi:hypothetical protein